MIKSPRFRSFGLLDIQTSYFTPALLVILGMGFLSGLPLALTASTLAFWLAESGVEKSAIGLFAAVATPYTLKFLWAPVMDSLPLPPLTTLLGRRRGWLAATQALLALSLLLLSFARPDVNPWLTALMAVIVAFLSASQDIVIDAYRVERLVPEEQGRGAAMTQLGYRMGMLFSSAGALYLAAYYGWQATYAIMASIMGIGIVLTLVAREPQVEGSMHTSRTPEQWLREAAYEPFHDFTKRQSWVLILLFVVLYKFADAFIGPMTNPFFYELGFEKTTIANIVKIYGTGATLLGIFIGGAWVSRFGAVRILFAAGTLHALTNLMFVVQAWVGADATVLALGISLENFTGGISAAAFVAYLSALCNVHYTATQYALLSSLAAFGRTWLSTPAGYVAEALGWAWFFALSALLAIPGLIVLWMLTRRFRAISPPAAGT